MLRYADRLGNPDRRPRDGREVRIFFATSLVPRRTPDSTATPPVDGLAPPEQ
jgi:hypothetical protein